MPSRVRSCLPLAALSEPRLADHTDTLIGTGVMMVAGEMTLTQVARAIFPHPTQTELFGELARRLLNRLRRTAKK
jgi:dihydrolipoamide dehydrogenase